MADYDKKNSGKRAEWYRDVVGPICNAAHAAGFRACGITAAAWNSEPAAGEAGSQLAAGKWPATLRNRAELLGEKYGIDFKKNTTFANLTNARAFVAQVQLEAAWSGQADAAEGGGAGGGGGDEVPYLLDPGYTWAPGPDGVLGTSDDTAEVLVPTVVEDTTPWLWIGLGTAALAGGVVWWLRTRQQAPVMGGAAFAPGGFAPNAPGSFAPSDGLYGYRYPWS